MSEDESPDISEDMFARYEEAKIHHFKTHLSRYIRMMEDGYCKAVIVKRGAEPVGLFMLYPKGGGKEGR